MTYVSYSNMCARLVRNSLKEPYRTEALEREKVHFSLSKWVDEKPQKPGMMLSQFYGSTFNCYC
ncbi:ATP synthase subunit epsilon, mitochondrial [Linum grandiflorum]